ncbi:MAG: PAS domain S-box protein, partial [Armatimonadia bacterium]|nr:PAS domain S-box protein [Armatimonadia bacterium]
RDEGLDSRFDVRMRTRDGRELLIAWHNVPFLDEDGRLESVFSIGADITALRRAERRLERLNNTLQALSGIAGLALRVDDARELLDRACATLVDTGACTGAWIAPVGDTGNPIGLVGSSMRNGTSPEALQAAIRELPDCIAQVLDGSRQVAINEISETCAACTFAPADTDVHGIATTISHGDRIQAVLVTHVRNSEPVGEEMQRLFCAIADDLGFALAMLEGRAMHERTERSLAERTRMLDAFFESSLDPAAILDRDFNFVRVNQAYADSCDLTPGDLIGRNHFDLYPHEENEAIFERVRDTGEVHNVRAKPFDFPDHPEWGTTWWDWTLVPIPGDDGEVELLSFWLRDVTEEQRAKQALEEQRDRLDEMVRERTAELQETNELLGAMIASAPVAVVLHDLDGNVTLWNPAAEEITGYSAEEAVGGPAPIVAEEDQGRYRASLDRVRSGEQWGGQIQRRHKNGSVIYLEVTSAPLRDADGNVTGSIGLFTDIGERVRAESERAHLLEQLEEERATLEAIVHNAPEGIVLTDEEARVTYVNPAAEELYRRPVPIGEDRTSHGQMELHQADGTPYEVDDLPLSRSALRGEVIRNEEMSIIWPDGQERDLLASTAPIRKQDGGITGAIAVFQDITEAKENERERERLMELLQQYADHLEEMVAERTRELADSRDELRVQRDFVDAVIEEAGSLVVVVDAHGAIVRFNHAAEEVSGWSADEARGRNFLELLIPADEREQVRGDFFGQLREGPGQYENWWRRKSGGRRRISWRLSIIRDEAGRMEFMIGTGWDVTEERRIARQLRESEEKYRELVENARTIIIRWDLDGTIRFVNEYGLEFFGYT